MGGGKASSRPRQQEGSRKKGGKPSSVGGHDRITRRNHRQRNTSPTSSVKKTGLMEKKKFWKDKKRPEIMGTEGVEKRPIKNALPERKKRKPIFQQCKKRGIERSKRRSWSCEPKKPDNYTAGNGDSQCI